MSKPSVNAWWSRSKLSQSDTLLISLASILDGVVGIVTMGAIVGNLRSAASLRGARRQMTKPR